MTTFVSRIATGIAILGLAAPAFASTNGTSMTAPSAQTSPARHQCAHKHNKVASASEKKADAQKAESKAAEKKVEKKGAVKSTKTETPAALSATPAPASK